MKFEYRDGKAYDVLKEIKKAIQDTKWATQVYLVGGAVRNNILGKEITDIDICVACPNGGIEFAQWICKEFGCYKEGSNPCIYPNFGTAKFNLRNIHDLSDINIECVTHHKYKESGEKPHTNSFYGVSLIEDARYRDLTINALYANLNTDTIIDPSGYGFIDIANKTLRTPNHSSVIFNNDPLRILRVIRFASELNFGIEAKTWIGMVLNAEKIKNNISQERITNELNKIMLCEKPSEAFYRMRYCGILQHILPEVNKLIGVEQGVQHFGDVFEHTMAVVDNTNKIVNHRWAALFHDIAKPYVKSGTYPKIHFHGHEYMSHTIADAVLRRMKFSNADVTQIIVAVKHHMRFKQSKDRCPSNKALRRFMSEVSSVDLKIVLDVINADNISHSPTYNMPNQVKLIIEKLNEMYVDKKENVKPPINGKDIMEKFNIKSGPQIGDLIEIATELFIENPEVTKEECLVYLENYVH